MTITGPARIGYAPWQQMQPSRVSGNTAAESSGASGDTLAIGHSSMALVRQRDSGYPYDGGVSGTLPGIDGKNPINGLHECQTCNNRKYKDVSDDSSVSFQTPTRISPEDAENRVRAHEQEHVSHEQVNAWKQGRRVTAQSVAIHYALCAECGRAYVAGGTTTTITQSESGQRGSERNLPFRHSQGPLNVYA